jgi:hypothetical protein
MTGADKKSPRLSQRRNTSGGIENTDSQNIAQSTGNVKAKMPEGLTPDERYSFSEYAGKLLSNGIDPQEADLQALAVIQAGRTPVGGTA